MVDLWGIAEKLNIDDIAVCHAGKFEDVEQLLKKDAELGILPPFTETDIRKRVYPSETLAHAKSFIVILEHYDPPVYKKEKDFMEIFLRQPAVRIIIGSCGTSCPG